MPQKKRTFQVEGEWQTLRTTDNLWERFSNAVDKDKYYPNNSEALRGLMQNYIFIVENKK